MKKQFLYSLLVGLILANAVLGQGLKSAKIVMNNISPDAIKAHMTFLSDDLLEGRLPGTRGFAIGSRYMETQFMALGLKPGVDNSSYVQPFTFKKAWVDDTESSLTLTSNNKEDKLE